MTPLRSLFIAPQWIGDAVMTQPLLAALRARNESISVAALPWVAPVYEMMPECDEVMVLPWPKKGLSLKLRWAWARAQRTRFDRAYLGPNTFKSALLPLWAGVPQRVGYQGESRSWLLTHVLANPRHDKSMAMVDFYNALAKPLEHEHEHDFGALDDHESLDLAPVLGGRPRLSMDPESIKKTLDSLGLTVGEYVVVACGAEYGPAKKWPHEHFARLIVKTPWPVILLGSDKDRVDAEKIVKLTHALGGQNIIDLTGKTSLKDAFAWIAGAKGLISNDSGLMHVGAAFGVRQVALFGSSSPEHTPALNERAKMIWLKNEIDYSPALNCAPCFKRVCPLGHTRCLQDLGVERVLSQVLSWQG
jgi:heptosyltransferase-2